MRKIFLALFSCLVLVSQAFNTLIPVDAQPAEYLVVEGKHVRFFLREQTSNFVPTTSINSKWLDIDVKMDGRVTKGEWTDAEVITFLPIRSPNLVDFRGNIYFKNTREFLFIGVDVISDRTNDASRDWVEISFVNYDSAQTHEKSVVYHLAAKGKTSSMKYIFTNGTKTFTTADLTSIKSSGAVYFDDNRMYELKLWLKDPALGIAKKGLLHIKLLINDGSSGKKCQYCAWEVGLASSDDRPGSSRSFGQMVAERVVPKLDGAYEIFKDLLKYTPYEGAKIDVIFSKNGTGIGPKNTVIVDANKFLPHLAANDDPDTYLYPLLHQLSHAFIPDTSALSLRGPLSAGFADLLAIEALNQMQIQHDDSLGAATLSRYENDGSPFAKLVWSHEHPSQTKYPTDALMYQIFKELLQEHGWRLFTNLLNLEVGRSNPADDKTSLSLFIHSVSIAAGKDVTTLFKDRWKFDIISADDLFDLELRKIEDMTAVQSESASQKIMVSKTKWLPAEVSLSAKGLPSGAKATWKPSKGNLPFETELTIMASPTTPTGSYVVNLTATAGSKSYSTSFNLLVKPIGELLKLELDSDSYIKAADSEFIFSTTLMSNKSSSLNGHLALFIDDRPVDNKQISLRPNGSEAIRFTWNSNQTDPTLLHIAQVKILSQNKTILDSNKVKFAVFEPDKRISSKSKSIVLTEPIAKDPDTKKNYKIAKLTSIQAMLTTKGQESEKYNIKLVAPNGKVIIGKDGLTNSPGKLEMNFELNKVNLKLSYSGYKAKRELLIIKPVQDNGFLPLGGWKFIIEAPEGKTAFNTFFKIRYLPSAEVLKGFK